MNNETLRLFVQNYKHSEGCKPMPSQKTCDCGYTQAFLYINNNQPCPDDEAEFVKELRKSSTSTQIFPFQREQFAKAADTIERLQAENAEVLKSWRIEKQAAERLDAENERLQKAILSYSNNPAGFDWAVLDKIYEQERTIERLQAENARLREYVQHRYDCNALKRYHIPNCPACGSINTRWGHGVHFESSKRCLDCDKAGWFEPKEVFGECDCGLDQALKEAGNGKI